MVFLCFHTDDVGFISLQLSYESLPQVCCKACEWLTWWAVLSVKAFIADALAVHAPAVTDAVVRTPLGAAVIPREVWETHTPSVHALPLVAAVTWTRHLVAVVPRVALMTHTPAIYTPAVVVAFVGTGGHWAIWAFPPRVAHATAGLLLVCTMAATARVQASRKKVISCYFMACK